MLEQLITSFVASCAFAIIFNCPKNALIKCGIIGVIGWMTYIYLIEWDINTVLANVMAAFIVAIVGQIFARVYKMPLIIFIVAGIVPLVPGGVAYDAMRLFAENNYESAVQLSANVLLLSGAIAIGLILSEVINQIYKKIRTHH